jgi:hypothetical protein
MIDILYFVLEFDKKSPPLEVEIVDHESREHFGSYVHTLYFTPKSSSEKIEHGRRYSFNYVSGNKHYDRSKFPQYYEYIQRVAETSNAKSSEKSDVFFDKKFIASVFCRKHRRCVSIYFGNGLAGVD